jgi:tetratricopeptide (TPR) repeat protein
MKARFVFFLLLISAIGFWPAMGNSQERSTEAYKWYEQGRKHFNNNEYDQAIDAFTRAAAAQTNFAEAYLYRGMVRAEQGDYERAIDDYTRALDFIGERLMPPGGISTGP